MFCSCVSRSSQLKTGLTGFQGLLAASVFSVNCSVCLFVYQFSSTYFCLFHFFVFFNPARQNTHGVPSLRFLCGLKFWSRKYVIQNRGFLLYFCSCCYRSCECVFFCFHLCSCTVCVILYGYLFVCFIKRHLRFRKRKLKLASAIVFYRFFFFCLPTSPLSSLTFSSRHHHHLLLRTIYMLW